MATLDKEVLIELYVLNNEPCDRLVSNPEKLISFTKDYQDRTGQDVSAAAVGSKMLNLRRLGQANGGLPRLRRKYNGRGPRWRPSSSS